MLFYKIFRAFRYKKERTEPNISPLNYEGAVVYNSFLCDFKAIYFYSSLVKAFIQVKTITQSTEDKANPPTLSLLVRILASDPHYRVAYLADSVSILAFVV